MGMHIFWRNIFAEISAPYSCILCAVGGLLGVAPVQLWAYFAYACVCAQLQLSFNKQTSHEASAAARVSVDVCWSASNSGSCCRYLVLHTFWGFAFGIYLHLHWPPGMLQLQLPLFLSCCAVYFANSLPQSVSRSGQRVSHLKFMNFHTHCVCVCRYTTYICVYIF